MLPCNPFRGRVLQQRVAWDGSIITGTDGDPLAVLAAQLNIPMHDINMAACSALACGAAPVVTQIWSVLALLGGSAG